MQFVNGLLVMLFVSIGTAQQNETFTVRGSVIESDTRNPIPQVNIEVNGGAYTTTDIFGDFKIEVKKDDELTIKHKDFQTVYYTIKDNERILVEVQPENTIAQQSKLKLYSRNNSETFKNLIDSSETYLKRDVQKSLRFLEKALAASSSAKQNAIAYEVLGNIYTHWKQYDLAVSNYRISLQSQKNNDVILKLGNAYRLNGNYQESLETYNSIKVSTLTNWQQAECYEGLGDVYKLTNNYDKAISSYQQGLKIAQKHSITPKITDLNSKIAQVYVAKGQNDKAQSYFNNSLQLAEGLNKKRAVEEKVKVADFQNNINNYSNEINLRKEALTDIKSLGAEAEANHESNLTTQKQNYKIGNAYALKHDYGNAITYLEKSIKEADNKADLVVQKDATRKLSEVYRESGNFNKALEAYQQYVDLVDRLYLKKEQEIAQAVRFSKDIATKQNRILSLESDRALTESKYQLSTEQSKRQKLIIYSLIGGVFLLLVTALFMYKYIRQQRLANNLLALKSLRSQMNPHFIFNALNSVNSFIALNDERTANKYLTDFSMLMRAVLENSEQDFIPLEKEIELLKRYTKLEHFRFQDKFDYNIQVDQGIDISHFVIPPMLLQPYIENAVWHGLRYKKEKGHLGVRIAQTESDQMQIIITDNGIGRERSKNLKTKNQKRQNSKGMGNIKKRVAILNTMYKDKISVAISNYQAAEDTGTKVVVTIKKTK